MCREAQLEWVEERMIGENVEKPVYIALEEFCWRVGNEMVARDGYGIKGFCFFFAFVTIGDSRAYWYTDGNKLL